MARKKEIRKGGIIGGLETKGHECLIPREGADPGNQGTTHQLVLAQSGRPAEEKTHPLLQRYPQPHTGTEMKKAMEPKEMQIDKLRTDLIKLKKEF